MQFLGLFNHLMFILTTLSVAYNRWDFDLNRRGSPQTLMFHACRIYGISEAIFKTSILKQPIWCPDRKCSCKYFE